MEHLLPSLLGVSHSLSHELQERTLFFGELGSWLDRLHGRLTVISSPRQALPERKAPQYPWLWRYVSHFTVGAVSRAVQHTKLWAFHWKVDDAEQKLDLVVSSANLTASAFKAQVQAGWKASLQLEGDVTQWAQRSWGELVPLLEALGASAGDNAKSRVDRLIQLLGRAQCPNAVTFVVSIPGSAKRGTEPLKKLGPVAIHILTPTVGNWGKNTLAAWSKDVGIAPGNIHLKWLDSDHPWARAGGWTLTEQASKVLRDNGVQLNPLPLDARFSDKHLDADERWSHAKLYLLRLPRRQKRQLLVTSANWSPAAWGAGQDERPRNFELGVLFETDWKMLEEIKGRLSAPFCTDRPSTGDAKLQWAEATWDGKHIELRARSSDSSKPIGATVSFSGGAEESVALISCEATLPWTDPDKTPLTVQFIQDTETLEVNVVDLRPLVEFSKTPLPEVDPSLAAALREAFLLQRYGGPAVDIDSVSGSEGVRGSQGESAPADDFSVQAYLDARAAFNVIDRWRDALGNAKADSVALERVRLDGYELCALYKRREGPAADLAVEELGWRLEAEA